jgi:hypothetical protein
MGLKLDKIINLNYDLTFHGQAFYKESKRI